MKLVLLAAMIIGIGSAFTTAQPKLDELWVVGPDGPGAPLITLTEAQSHEGAYCESSFNTEDCTYLDQEKTEDPNSAIGRFVYP